MSGLTPQQKWNRANPAAIRAHQLVFRAVHAGETFVPCVSVVRSNVI